MAAVLSGARCGGSTHLQGLMCMLLVRCLRSESHSNQFLPIFTEVSRHGQLPSHYPPLALRGGSSADAHVSQCDTPPQEAAKPLQTAGVGAALSVNSKGQVVFSQMVPGMPAANSGAIHIGDSLVAVDEWEVPAFKGNKPYKNHTTDLKPNELLISISKRILGLAGTHVRLTLLKSTADDQLVSEHSSSRDLTSAEGQQVREAVCQDNEAGRKGRLTLRCVHVNLVR
jgi:hypothetical protein